MNRSIPVSYSKRNPAQRPQAQRSKPRRLRPHGHPRPDRYRPPARPRPTRFMLDVGRNISLTLTLERHHIAPSALTLTKIGGTND